MNCLLWSPDCTDRCVWRGRERRAVRDDRPRRAGRLPRTCREGCCTCIHASPPTVPPYSLVKG